MINTQEDWKRLRGKMMNQISNYLYLDVEADGLYEEAKNIWVIVAKVG